MRTGLDKGLSQDTVNRELAVVRRILSLAARVWRDQAGNPWLADAPLIPVRRSASRESLIRCRSENNNCCSASWTVT